MALEPEEIKPEPQPEVDEEAALWGDLEPKETTAEEEPELTQEEVEAALGKRPPGWLILAGIAGITAILVVGFLLIGNIIKKKPSDVTREAAVKEELIDTSVSERPAAEDIAAEDEVVDIVDIEEGEITEVEPSPISPDDVVDITRREMAVAVDSTRMDTILDLPPEDVFHQLLNAQISSEETDAFDVTDYDQFLLTPVEPVIEAEPIPMRPYPVVPDTLAELIRALEALPVDTARIFIRIDSLKQELDILSSRLAASEELTDEVLRELEAAAIRTDSLRAVEIKRLAKIVDVMKPEYAATMLKDKRDRDIKDVLFRVKPRTAAKVLENFPPARRSQLAGSIVKR